MRRLPEMTLIIALLAAVGGCRGADNPGKRVRVFAAASLDQVLADLSADLHQPGDPEVEREISGSQEAARKIAEYGREADVLLVADYRVIDWILGPSHAEWSIRFATNELVIGYSDNSRYATDITADNWPEVLLRPGVKVARADENLAPVGYQTLLCWQLATEDYGDLVEGRDLSAELLERTSDDLVRPSVIGLVPLLGTRADYAFIYRSVAHSHNLPYVRLAPEVNLSDPAHAEGYARAQVTLEEPERTIRGAPIIYGATIPTGAPDPQAGVAFLRLLLGPAGRSMLERNGFTPLPEPVCDTPEALPAELRDMLETPTSGQPQ